MSARLFAFDTETTGLDASKDEIISIAMLLLDSSFNELNRQVIYALPSDGIEVHPKAAEVNGYTKEKWIAKGAVSQDVLHREIKSFLVGQKDLFPLGHNVGFDVDFLTSLFKKHNDNLRGVLSYHKVDTVGIAVFSDLALFGRMGSNYRLTELTERFELPHAEAHDALSDVLACVALFKHLYAHIGGKELVPPPVVHSRLLMKQADDWRFRAGKHKDKDVKTLAVEKPDYLRWVLENVSDLSSEQTDHIRNALSNA